MDPNSTHQLWSLWIATVTVPWHKTHDDPLFKAEVKRACSSFYRKLFGSASEMKIDQTQHAVPGRLNALELETKFVVQCRTEGAPAPEVSFRRAQMKAISEFFGTNLRRYGRVNVRVDVRVEAGDAGDGRPPAQLIMVPPIVIEEQVNGKI